MPLNVESSHCSVKSRTALEMSDGRAATLHLVTYVMRRWQGLLSPRPRVTAPGRPPRPPGSSSSESVNQLLHTLNHDGWWSVVGDIPARDDPELFVGSVSASPTGPDSSGDSSSDRHRPLPDAAGHGHSCVIGGPEPVPCGASDSYVHSTGWPDSCVNPALVWPPDSSADSSSERDQRPTTCVGLVNVTPLAATPGAPLRSRDGTPRRRGPRAHCRAGLLPFD